MNFQKNKFQLFVFIRGIRYNGSFLLYINKKKDLFLRFFILMINILILEGNCMFLIEL